MQLSCEGSGCGGRSHPRHRHHLRRMLPPTTPPTPAPTASAEIPAITINPVDVAIAVESAELLLLGKLKCYGRGGGVTAGESAAVMGEARGGGIGGTGGGVAGGVERRHYRRGRLQE